MLKKTSTSISELGTKKTLSSMVLVANAFIWYYVILHFLEGFVTKISPVVSVSTVSIWGLHFSGLILAALAGALAAKRVERNKLLVIWMAFGVISSLALLAANTSNVLLLSLIGLFLGISLGFGMPTCMNYFSDTVPIETRGRTSGIALFASGIGIAVFSIVSISNVIILGIILAVWRMSGLVIFETTQSSGKTEPKNNVASYKSIINQRSFTLYFIPWLMFSLVNYLVAPLSPNPTSSLAGNVSLIQTGFMGLFAVLGGFLIDSLGRKFVAIFGFITLGVGSAVLGISTTNNYFLYFNAAANGIAWGLLLVVFILTIWGDLSYSSTSDKFYAIGASPFFISAFLGLTFGSYIFEKLGSPSALFSFGAFFLFLAVLPLIYAPETLNEKTIRTRELKSYLEKAQKIAQKEAGKNINQDEKDTVDADEEKNQETETPLDEEARKLAEKYY